MATSPLVVFMDYGDNPDFEEFKAITHNVYDQEKVKFITSTMELVRQRINDKDKATVLILPFRLDWIKIICGMTSRIPIVITTSEHLVDQAKRYIGPKGGHAIHVTYGALPQALVSVLSHHMDGELEAGKLQELYMTELSTPAWRNKPYQPTKE